ncbi:MAG TPA: hypothetical protein VNW15_00055 [Rhizomicrobium sp.]|nr:hypothetical protein [Rhizomicrobium sp.]
MAGDLSNMMTEADEAVKRPLDPMLKIARWPEWGVERWEEIEQNEVSSFHTFSGGDGPEQSQEFRVGRAGSQAGAPSQEIHRTEIPSFHSVSEGGGRERPQKVPIGKGTNQAEPPSGHGGRAENKPRKNISGIALGIMVGLLVLGGHFNSFKMSSAEVPAPRPVTMGPPPLRRSTLIARPARQPATAAPAVILKADLPQTLPDAILAPLWPPENGANSMRSPRLYAAGVAITAPMVPQKIPSQPQHAIIAGHKPTRSRVLAHPVGAKTVRRSARYVSARACIRIYPETGRCH